MARATDIAPGTFEMLAAAGGGPVVMLVGRANVGKSTLFNRMVGGGRAIVSPIAGTTRDLNLARAVHDSREFIVADSGGLELYAQEPAAERATAEALKALGAADLIVLVIDGRAGVAAGDQEALELIRQTGRPVILAVNKVDNPRRQAAAAEAYSLGIESVNFVSASHGSGIGELLDEVTAHLSPRETQPAERPALRLALIGRPNVGKSSLLNRLSGFERAIVDEHPGTTRDPVEIPLKVGEQNLLLIDTAGIRRPTKVEGQLEHHSVGRAIETIRRADVLALVVDASEGITDQDARLARLVDNNDRALIMVCNKWDVAAGEGRRVPVFVRDERERYPFLEFAPMLIVSALTGDGIGTIIPTAAKAGEAWRSQFQTSRLNQVLAGATTALEPPLVAGRRLKLMYVTQVSTAPPRIAIFSNLERDIPVHYRRYLEGRFRAALDLQETGTPFRIEFRRAGKSRSEGGRHERGAVSASQRQASRGVETDS